MKFLQELGERCKMIKIAKSSKKDIETLFLESSRKSHIPAAIVEKDFWVCFVLEILFNDKDFKDVFIFRGGTSLSKCFNIISRFSEDIDLTLNRDIIGISDEQLWEERKNKETDRFIEMIRYKTNQYLMDNFVPLLSKKLNQLQIDGLTVKLDPNDQLGLTVLVEFSPSFANAYIRPIIKLEIGSLGSKTPVLSKKVSPYVVSADDSMIKECEFLVAVIDAKRTFFDKITILHSETSRISKHPDRYARHYYDTFKLSNSEVYQESLLDIQLLLEAIKHKNKFYRSPRSKYDDILKGQLKLVPNSDSIDILKVDYENMRDMLFGEIPSFDEIIARLREIEKELNSNITKFMKLRAKIIRS